MPLLTLELIKGTALYNYNLIVTSRTEGATLYIILLSRLEMRELLSNTTKKMGRRCMEEGDHSSRGGWCVVYLSLGTIAAAISLGTLLNQHGKENRIKIKRDVNYYTKQWTFHHLTKGLQTEGHQCLIVKNNCHTSNRGTCTSMSYC